MFMQYQGGGVGHSSTREATNKFLFDRDQLDVPDGDESVKSDIEEDENGDSDVNSEDDVADAVRGRLGEDLKMRRLPIISSLLKGWGL